MAPLSLAAAAMVRFTGVVPSVSRTMALLAQPARRRFGLHLHARHGDGLVRRPRRARPRDGGALGELTFRRRVTRSDKDAVVASLPRIAIDFARDVFSDFARGDAIFHGALVA